MAQPISKQKAIELIVDDLRLGIAKSVILSKFVELCQKDTRTIERYFKEAEILHLSIQKDVEIKKATEYTQSEIERLKSNILEREKVLEMSSEVLKIAYENVVNTKDDKSIQSFATAQHSFSKLVGFDAPTKQDISVKENKGAESIFLEK